MFQGNKEINRAIERFTKKLLINGYTGQLWEPITLNSLNRETLAEEFSSEFFTDERLKSEGYDCIGGKKNMDLFLKYVAKKIDKLLPRLYFMEANRKMSEKYTSLLTKRIYTTNGKDGLECTKDIKYFYEHDFSEEEKYIKETNATNKQLDFLEKLCEQNGYQLYNQEYLSKAYATSLIEYLNGHNIIEPIIFDFFTTAI